MDDSTGLSGVDKQICVPWWSFTKTVLATITLKLVAQGRLTLDEPIKNHKFTLRHLLQHQAGLTDYGALSTYHEAVRNGDEPWCIERLLEESRANDLLYEPGQSWRYSNIGYLFVRQIIEDTTGQSLDNALQQLFFNDLGLNSVRLANTREDLEETIWDNSEKYNPRWVYHGLLIGSPNDAVYFLHQLMTEDLLPPDLLNQMTKVHQLGGPLIGRPWQTTGYGLGLMIGHTKQAGLAIGHSGVGPYSLSAIYHFGDRAVPQTVASFTKGDDEGLNEHEAVRLGKIV